MNEKEPGVIHHEQRASDVFRPRSDCPFERATHQGGHVRLTVKSRVGGALSAKYEVNWDAGDLADAIAFLQAVSDALLHERTMEAARRVKAKETQ